jgi:endonuclease/exonuclease/phosphatase family metal-dependent hydrolase
MKEEQGKESKLTLFFHRKPERPYHIDYAFISKSLIGKNNNNIEVGDPDLWLEYSDHMPLVFYVAG